MSGRKLDLVIVDEGFGSPVLSPASWRIASGLLWPNTATVRAETAEGVAEVTVPSPAPGVIDPEVLAGARRQCLDSIEQLVVNDMLREAIATMPESSWMLGPSLTASIRRPDSNELERKHPGGEGYRRG